MEIYFDHVVLEKFGKRSKNDKRKKVNYVLASYKCKKGIEHRKGFEFPKTYSFDRMFEEMPKVINQ